MQPVTVLRAKWLVGLALLCYALALVGMGFALGFDHKAEQWLLASVLVAVAIGISASALLRIVILVLDVNGRAAWWGRASPIGRAIRAVLLGLRLVLVVALWIVAVRALPP